MCGIAGILGRTDEANRLALDRIARAMAHRGPDLQQVWVGQPDARGLGCLLAHNRLSILDLSTAANQPMSGPSAEKALVFNGEIYNYQHLREDLLAAGESLHSTGDTEALYRVLCRDGADGVARLRGMFAFGFWDERDRRLLLARDPLGIKPLYVARNPDGDGTWSLIFASEVRAILASGLLGKPRLDPAAIASVVWNGFVMGPGTIVRGVELLRAGEVLSLDAIGRPIARRSCWNFPPADGPKNADEAQLREALRESVRLHLASDVPLGVFLSGGVDSGSVANLAQKAVDRRINTFTLAFEEQEYNEGHHARAIAEAIGTDHREILLTESDFVGHLPRALDTLDQPTFDGLNSFYMSKAVREAGLTVALVGTGGDELFGGYKSFSDLPRLLRFARGAAAVPKSLQVLAAELIARLKQPRRGAVAPQTRWAKLPEMVRNSDDLIALYQLAYALFLPDFQGELLCDEVRSGAALTHGLPPPLLEQLTQETRGRSCLSAISVLEQRCFLGQRLLRDSDAASMAVSLELRLPLVDQALTQVVCRLPDELRYAPVGCKPLLRRIGLEGLDPALFDRPKSGFVLPFDRWIRKGLGREMDQAMRDPEQAAAVGLNGAAVRRLWEAYQAGAPGMYWSRVWAIFVLMHWCCRHGVSL